MKKTSLTLMSLLCVIIAMQKTGYSQNVNDTVPDYGVYTISSLVGGSFIEVSGDPKQNEKFKNQRSIVLWEASIANNEINPWQKWHIIHRTTNDGIKYYHIRNVYSGKLLEVPAGSKEPGIQLQQYHEFPLFADQQLWSLKEISTGSFVITNKGSGLALCNANASRQNGASVTQEEITGGENQKWIVSKQPACAYRDDSVVRFFERNEKWMGSVAFDQGSSIPLDDGRVLWVTQDAWDGWQLEQNKLFLCSHFFTLGNSMFLQPSLDNWDPAAAPNIKRTNSAQNRPLQICDIQPNNTFAWPGNGVQIGNKVYLHCGDGRGLGITSQSIWVLSVSDDSVWQTERTQPAGMSSQTDVNYALGMVKAGDGYVYAFGFKSYSYNYEMNVYVARFSESSPQEWTFWNGQSWGKMVDVSDAAVVGKGKASSAVSYINGKYVLLTMDQGFLCDSTRNVYITTADSPTSGFNRTLTKVYTIPEYIYGKFARYYTPNLHPQHKNGRNELLITYSLNYLCDGADECFEEEGVRYRDPYYYRVKGVRVPYSLVGIPNDRFETGIRNTPHINRTSGQDLPNELLQAIAEKPDTKVMIFDICGRMVFSGFGAHINTSKLANGSYVLLIKSNFTVSSQKFVKSQSSRGIIKRLMSK